VTGKPDGAATLKKTTCTEIINKYIHEFGTVDVERAINMPTVLTGRGKIGPTLYSFQN
jgi:hypothetical protein